MATGLDHTTVAAHVRALREEGDPLVDLMENDRGLQGDLYQLRIPDEIADRATRVAWRPGKLHALAKDHAWTDGLRGRTGAVHSGSRHAVAAMGW